MREREGARDERCTCTFCEPITGDLCDLHFKAPPLEICSHDNHHIQHCSCYSEIMRNSTP